MIKWTLTKRSSHVNKPCDICGALETNLVCRKYEDERTWRKPKAFAKVGHYNVCSENCRTFLKMRELSIT